MDAANRVERVFDDWFGNMEVSDPWERLFPESDDPKSEFVYTWPRVKWAAPVLEIAEQEAAHLPLKPLESSSPQYDRFI